MQCGRTQRKRRVRRQTYLKAFHSLTHLLMETMPEEEETKMEMVCQCELTVLKAEKYGLRNWTKHCGAADTFSAAEPLLSGNKATRTEQYIAFRI
jgi:hypothetical protein